MMINSSKLLPTSSSDSSGFESKKTTLTSDLEQNDSIPPSLNFLQCLKLEEMEVQSPENSLWETYFPDQLDGGDFMISSPVRNNLPSPQGTTNLNYTNNYSHCAHQIMHGQSLLGQSPPPTLSLQNTNTKGKGLSPLHRVFHTSPNNNQFMQIESLSLPALENYLDDYEEENEFLSYSTMHHKESTAELCYDDLTTVPALLDCLSMPNSSRFLEPETSACGVNSQLISQQSDVCEMGSLLQQLEEERRHEKQKQQQHPPQLQQAAQNLEHTLTIPISIALEQEQDSGLQLVHLLLACAEAVAKEEHLSARRYLHHLNRVVSPLGDSMQRVASCFVDALTARLNATLSSNPTSSNSKPFTPFPPDNLEILNIYQILYQACPYIKFAHFTANQAIFEAFESEEHVHIIDLDILQGYQWPSFMQALAARPGGPPFLRITGVGTSPEAVIDTGRCLTELANSLQLPFEFHPVGEQLENLKPHMLHRQVGEALAVNSVNRLHRVPGDRLGNLLTMIRDQAPNIVTIVEQEASHNGPYFLGRFLEALHYYSAIFDSLDATFPADSVQRANVEQCIFAPEIRNIVACEGAERAMRHERLEKWRKIMEGKGFGRVELSANAVTQSKILLSLYSCEGYSLTEEHGGLLLGWQDRAIISASAWRC